MLVPEIRASVHLTTKPDPDPVELFRIQLNPLRFGRRQQWQPVPVRDQTAGAPALQRRQADTQAAGQLLDLRLGWRD